MTRQSPREARVTPMRGARRRRARARATTIGERRGRARERVPIARAWCAARRTRRATRGRCARARARTTKTRAERRRRRRRATRRRASSTITTTMRSRGIATRTWRRAGGTGAEGGGDEARGIARAATARATGTSRRRTARSVETANGGEGCVRRRNSSPSAWAGSTAMRAMTMSSRAGWSGREARDDEAGTKRKDSGSFLRLI